jgi:hypothetical protein
MFSASSSPSSSRLLLMLGLSAACLSAAGASQAQEHGVVFAGASYGPDPSGYAGAVLALPGAPVGQGFGARTVIYSSDYSYNGAPGHVKGQETGIDFGPVYQFSGDWGYLNLAAGARFHDTHLSPDDPTNLSRGAKWDGFLSADGAKTFGPWRLAALGSYGVDLREYNTRVELTRLVTGQVRLGAEAAAVGDPSYQREYYGAVLSFIPVLNWELRLSGGAETQQSQSGGYGTASFSYVF